MTYSRLCTTTPSVTTTWVVNNTFAEHRIGVIAQKLVSFATLFLEIPKDLPILNPRQSPATLKFNIQHARRLFYPHDVR